jgi:hypothetical protein
MNGNSTGAEPVAMTKFLAVQLTGAALAVPAGGVTSSDFGRVNGGVAGEDGDLARLGELADAADELRHDVVLALHHRRADRVSTEPSFTPCSAAWCLAQTACSLEWSRALLGMQPTLRQVPPSVPRFSTRATLRPELCRAKRAHVAARAGADDDEIEGEFSGHEETG